MVGRVVETSFESKKEGVLALARLEFDDNRRAFTVDLPSL